MTYLDTIFLTSVQHPNIRTILSANELNSIIKLSNVLKSANYITEYQSKSIIKLLKTYHKELGIDLSILNTAKWKHQFRNFEHYQKLYINHNKLVIEYSYSNFLKKEITKIHQKLENSSENNIALTELNIITLVEGLQPLNFEIEDQIIDYYNAIKLWKISDYIDQYKLETMTQPTFRQHISTDLGVDTILTSNIIADRSRRYQYYITDQSNKIDLESVIAYRSSNNIWVDNTVYSLSDVINALINLQRLPVLIIFSSSDSKKSLNEIIAVSEVLKDCNITEEVGIYFRMSNADECGSRLNQFISANNYNTNLTTNTVVAGIQSTKLPKFFIKSDWKPMSIISLNNILTHNKTAIYANCCDLIINYTSHEPIIKLWELK